MAVFEPSGNMYIGHVDWDDSYRNVRLYTSEINQRSGILAMLTGTLNRNTYTYIRKDGAVRVAFNAEELYKYNYVAYRNNNYGDKMFYAFIADCIYINENTTELKLVTDVMQTWAFDYELRECFIEREHVDQDTIGLHTVPEPAMDIQHDVFIEHDFVDENAYKVVVQTNSAPLITTNVGDYQINYGSKSVVGGFYNNVFSGAKYYAFEPGTGDHSDILFQWLDLISRTGGTEGISNIFMFPKAFLPPVGDDNGVTENTDPIQKSFTQPLPGEIFGYTPKNKKVLTYPYTYIQLLAPGKGHNDYRFEWFNDPTNATFNYYVPLDADANLICMPVAYQHSHGENYAEAFFMPFTNKLSWVNSAFDTWSAQNMLGNLLTTAMSAIPLAKGLQAMSTAAAVSRSAATSTAQGRPTAGALPGHVTPYPEIRASANASFAAGKADALSGAIPLAQQAAEVYRMNAVPDKQCGSSSGNGLFAIGAQHLVERVMVPRLEYLEIIDDFFSRYGYEVDKLSVVARNNRTSWNYCKTRGCCIYGNVPDRDARVIESVYDAGVTFWHTDDIGNYELDNSINLGG